MSIPLHDWARVPADLFHDFHQGWSVRIADALNAGILPKGLSALIEPYGGLAAVFEPTAADILRTSREVYAARANRIIVTRHLRETIAVIEIVSPGNKDSRAAIRDFVDKTIEFLYRGIHVLIVDLFPPTARDPRGIHGLIWDDIGEEPFQFPDGKDRTLVSYQAGDEKVAYVEPVSVGDLFPEMRLFLAGDFHVAVPLATTYDSTWNATPEILRTAVETGELPLQIDA